MRRARGGAGEEGRGSEVVVDKAERVVAGRVELGGLQTLGRDGLGGGAVGEGVFYFWCGKNR